ncbi:MAG TPA: hypothetical protein VFO14_11725 [Vicinamibacterales bacterium]|nr:hypothetical protein [Vicinamibacterales bacterium]
MDFEKLGLFYLGKRYDPDTKAVVDEPILYDSRDLVTHAVCVGMTGSGKTGLCLDLVEEAAIDGVPVIAIDPKGDLGNLLLTFPGLSAEEFAPWIDEDEARRAGRTREAHAAEEARRWKEGLAAWGQDGARIERLRKSADFTIYTPGSSAGRPVSILTSFAAPPDARPDNELLVERAAGTATSLLTLAGVEAEPRSREHTLLATLFTNAWRDGRDLDLAGLIHDVQSPSIEKVGVVDLESFYPAKERFDLSMRLNGLLAAPGFQQWLDGAPLDPSSLLYTAEGRPRVAIFSIAHLGDAERMFFVSLLLHQVVAWMRRQTGTTSLRAIVYMDEIMGYFPPVANPPAKGPLLTILKQGRAFGVGALLATQNPVDLDYKGLGNAGTWFLGRLQTDRDKLRVLDGLESAATGGLNRADAERMLSSLDKRVFLLHNVHEPQPVLFQTRWTMSYLRGPLSREEVRLLQGSGVQGSGVQGSGGQGSAVAASSRRPVVPPEIPQFFVPSTGANPQYRPVVLGAAQVVFSDAKHGISEQRDVLYAAPISGGAVAVDWDSATRLDVDPSDLAKEPAGGASFQGVPPPALLPRNYTEWEKAFKRFVGQAEQVEVFSDPELKLTSRVGESERDFRIRLQDAQREARDRAVEALRKKYASKQGRIADQIRRAEAAVERETQQASQAKLQTTVSMGATLLGALFGRKMVSTGTIGRATTAARGMGRSMKESGDIERAAENLEAVRERERALEEEIQREIQAITDRLTGERQYERFALAPKRGQVGVQFVALGWL